MKVLHFNIQDELSEISLSCRTLKTLTKKLLDNCDNKGFNNLECVYTWNLEDKDIKCYGFTEGDESQRNKHKLPIDDDENFNLYGCLFLIGFNKSKPVDLHISEYAMLSFYDDDDSDDSGDSDDNNDDNLNNDKNLEVDKIEISYSDGVNELDTDTHQY